MNKHDLNEKRLEPCVAEVYATAIGPTKDCFPQSYETWKNHGVWAFYDKDMKKTVTVVPIDCYYIPGEQLKKIVAKWCKGLHGFWYYTPKLTHSDPDYDEHVKELEAFRTFEAEVSNDKTLTHAQRAAKIKKEALKHNFMWRSRDREYINFNVYLGVSPNSNEEWVKKNHAVYNAIEEAAKAGKIENVYIDFVHMNEFTYNKNGKPLFARVESVDYYHEGDKLIRKEIPGRVLCNLYGDDGNFVENLWNYEDIRRRMSAETMEIMITRYKPVVIETLKAQGKNDVAEWLAGDNYMDRDLKQCFAVWIMKQWFLARNVSSLI